MLAGTVALLPSPKPLFPPPSVYAQFSTHLSRPHLCARLGSLPAGQLRYGKLLPTPWLQPPRVWPRSELVRTECEWK